MSAADDLRTELGEAFAEAMVGRGDVLVVTPASAFAAAEVVVEAAVVVVVSAAVVLKPKKAGISGKSAAVSGFWLKKLALPALRCL